MDYPDIEQAADFVLRHKPSHSKVRMHIDTYNMLKSKIRVASSSETDSMPNTLAGLKIEIDNSLDFGEYELA